MWHKVAKTSDLADGAAQELTIEGQSIALFKISGKFYAIANHCMHRGGPLATGYIEGSKVTCPWHGWEFDVKTGDCHTLQGSKQKTYPTKIEKNYVFIDC